MPRRTLTTALAITLCPNRCTAERAGEGIPGVTGRRVYLQNGHLTLCTTCDDGRVPVVAFDEFTEGYIDAALWSSTAYGSPEEDAADPPAADGQRRGNFDGSFQDCGYTVRDVSPALLARVLEDCAAFQAAHAADLDADGCPDHAHGGHDFWLTRNGHGAGFWDGDWPKAIGRRLTDAAHAYGSSDWYMGDDGQIHA